MARPGGVLLPALVGLSISMGSALADTLDQGQATAVLKRVFEAARQLSFKGTFVYQKGDQVETMRVFHLVEGNHEYEKLEMLDGPRREFIRMDDEVQCFYPEAKRVTRERRVAHRMFPALLPEQIETITEQYWIRKGEPERIAGYDSQALELEPRDGMRYGHKFWTETRTGLLLKARMEDEHHNIVEQFSFTQLEIGPVTRSLVRPSYPPGPDWRIDRYSPPPEVNAETDGWIVGLVPSGFRKIMERRRSKQGNSVPVTHIVYSDGLAAVSVFIEPAASRSRINAGLTRQGSINIYTRTISENVVTVLGETPASTVMQMGDSISYHGK